MANVDPDVGGPIDPPEEGKKESLLSKVKDKAKGTVQKLKNKVKKGSDDSAEDVSSAKSGGEHGDEPTTDDLEGANEKGAQREIQGGTQSSGIDGVDEELTGSGKRVSFGSTNKVAPEDDKLKPYARSEAEKDPLTVTPLIATPTSYGEPHTTVEDVMPPSMISPTSVSEFGEESSSNLGNIPEAKDEERAAAKEVMEGGRDADINEGFKETFHQKDLQAIDGLPKPRGFDVGNGERVNSGDLGFQANQALADETLPRETEGNVEGVPKGGDREFPADGAWRSGVIEPDNESQHPPGSEAEFKDSMFSSNDIHDLKPNEPSAAEAKRASEIGTFSREFDPEAAKSGSTEGEPQHPPGSEAEFKDSMFSSGATDDLKPNEPDAAEANHGGEIGPSSRDFDPEAAKSSDTEGDNQHPPGSEAEFNDSMFSSGETGDLKPNEPEAAEAKHAGEIGTFSRDFDPEAAKSGATEGEPQHPPGSEAEFKDSMFSSGETGDLKPNEPEAAEAKHAGEIGTFSRDFDPEAAKSSGTGGDNQQPPGSEAEFNDSMFSSGATDDLTPNEPNAAEAEHAREDGTSSRDFDPEATKSSGTEGNDQHPRGSEAEFKDRMFSSSAADGLTPNEPNAAEAKHAGEIGTFSRDFDPEAAKSSGKEEAKEYPPASEAEFEDSMFSSGDIQDLKPNEPEAAEAKHAGEIGIFSRGVDSQASNSSSKQAE
ncbi:unnamed protein product [Calypogeia fissa]